MKEQILIFHRRSKKVFEVVATMTPPSFENPQTLPIRQSQQSFPNYRANAIKLLLMKLFVFGFFFARIHLTHVILRFLFEQLRSISSNNRWRLTFLFDLFVCIRQQLRSHRFIVISFLYFDLHCRVYGVRT